MCMLCVIPVGVIPSREKLENSALNNPHGFGFAIAVPEENRIIVERTMDADESINRFLELRQQYLTGYAMWHARLATHGSRNVTNCHPFRVGKDTSTYLAHNGILDITIPHADDRSDTRVFAEELLPALGGVTALDNDWVWEMLEEYTSGSKVCVLTVNPEAKHQMYLLNASAGKEDADGVWWSNDSCYLTSWHSTYKSKPAVAGYYNGSFDMWDDRSVYNKDKEDTKDYECPECKQSSEASEIDAWYNHCPYCDFCWDCMSGWDECFCYSSSYKSKQYDGKHSSSIAKHVIPSTRIDDKLPF